MDSVHDDLENLLGKMDKEKKRKSKRVNTTRTKKDSIKNKDYVICSSQKLIHKEYDLLTTLGLATSNKAVKGKPKSYVIKDKHVVELNLCNRELKKIPEEVFEFYNLKKLYLEDNMLTHLPEKILNLDNLTFLNISSNTLANLSDVEVISRLKKSGVKVHYDQPSLIPDYPDLKTSLRKNYSSLKTSHIPNYSEIKPKKIVVKKKESTE